MHTDKKPRPLLPLVRLSLLPILLGCCIAAQAGNDQASRYYEDAQQRYEKKDIDGAIIQLRNAIQIDRNLLAAQLLLGKALLRKGELQAADAALDEAIKQGVSRSEVAIPKGQLYLIVGDYKRLLDEITTTGMPAGVLPDILTLRGSAYAATNANAAAGKAFSEARALAPRSATPLIAEAAWLIRTGEREKAKADLAKALELEPDNTGAWTTQGNLLQTLRDSKGALAAYDKALQLEPKNIEARVARAGYLVQLNRDAEAAKDLKQLRDWDLADAKAAFYRGFISQRKGDISQAKADYTECVELIALMPPGLIATDDVLNLVGALANKSLGDNERARENLRNLLTINPNHFAGQILAASIALESRDLGLAQQLISNLQRQKADDPQVLFLSGSLSMARRKYEQAAEAFEKAVNVQPSPESLRELALTQLALGLGQQGMSNLERVLAANPDDGRAVIQLVTAYVASGFGAKAVKLAEDTAKRNPDNLVFLNYLGNIRGRTGDKKGARAAFKQVLSKDPAFKPALINLSWLDIEEKRFDEARVRLATLLKQDNTDTALLFQLGVLELRAGRNTEAIGFLERAMDAERQDPRAGLALMDLYNGIRQPEKALQVGKTLAARFSDNMAVILPVGRAYAAMGDLSNARAYFQEATRLANFDADMQVAVGRLQVSINNLEGAGYNLQKAQQAKPEALSTLVFAVELAAKRGDNAKVDVALKALQTRYPTDVQTLLTVAHVTFARGQFAQSVPLFQAVMAKQPSAANALLVARAMTAAGDAEKGLAVLEDWSSKQVDAQLLRVLAAAQLQLGKPAAAKASFARLLAMNPQDVGLISAYALLLQKLKDPAALATAERAKKLAPDSAEANDALGWVLTLNGQTDAGLRNLRDARLRNPLQGEIRFHLAYALAKAGRRSEAREELKAAMSGDAPAANGPELQALKVELGL